MTSIGFHLGEGGNKTGIGEYMSQLNNAQIPFSIKSVDSEVTIPDNDKQR